MARAFHEYEAVRELVAEGLNTCEISRRTRIPRTTVRTWLRFGFHPSTRDRPLCAPPHSFCWSVVPQASYAYLLGQYLGDGWITKVGPRHVYCLRVFCATAYPGIIAECVDAISAVMPSNRVGTYRLPGECIQVQSYSKHWQHLLPQHGPGMKHARPIVLEEWQRSIVEGHPEMLVRGLIHSDGCRVVNKVRRRGKPYEYPRYFFSNRSEDIKSIFCDALDQLGVSWRRDGDQNISIARRESVTLLDTFVGPKY